MNLFQFLGKRYPLQTFSKNEELLENQTVILFFNTMVNEAIKCMIKIHVSNIARNIREKAINYRIIIFTSLQ